MATSPANVNRVFDGASSSALGINSFLNPARLGKNQASWGVNVINRGGDWYTRPGYESMLRYPDGKAQGATFFTPTGGFPSIVTAVSGRIYVSEFPFTSYRQLTNIVFDPFVEHIAFEEATQGVDNGVVINPKSVLIMQDGSSKAAYYDGATARHLLPGGSTNETVIGLWMVWVGGRLWVARGREIFASDIYDPLHFTENIYLSGGGSLQAMDGDVITAMERTADNRALLVFTIGNTTIIRANITDRSQWQTTQDFITLQFPGVGCVGGKAIGNNDGELWWFSVEGVRRFTQTGEAIRHSSNSVASIEMKRSFDNMSPTMNRICFFSFENYLGFSVPSGDVFNRHTWVLDTSVASQLGASSPPAWQGIWMGTRPVEWLSANINGVQRVFYISQDYCGIRLWEAFKDDFLDNGNRIFCSLEENGLDFNEQFSFKKFRFSEIHATKVAGIVDFTSEYKGDWGCWKENASVTLCAKDCLTIEDMNCEGNTRAVYPQNRYLKTQDAGLACQSREGEFSENIGTFFQSRFRWTGKMGVRMYKSQADQFQENSNGQCMKSDAVCRELLCCDPEVDYRSHIDDSYGYPTSGGSICSI